MNKNNVTVVPASKENIKLFQPYVTKVLYAIGHPEAWVTDESSIGDFLPLGEDYQEFVNSVAANLGVGINKGDFIVDIAMRLKALEPANGC